jgi:hypothetical protein
MLNLLFNFGMLKRDFSCWLKVVDQEFLSISAWNHYAGELHPQRGCCAVVFLVVYGLINMLITLIATAIGKSAVSGWLARA